MKLGIMQPYFFPYIGYFSLINYVDKFVLFDTPQYINHGWINRNRIIKQGGGSTYIMVPLKKSCRETPINEMYIDNSKSWKDKILGQLTIYKRKAPYYSSVVGLVQQILEGDYNKISDLNEESLISICQYLGIVTNIEVYSKMNLQIDAVNAPDEWALNITNAMGYDIYVNPPGGKSFFDKSKYDDANVKLEFLEAEITPYVQRIGYFEPGLSIIDILMFCSVDEISEMLKSYQIT